MILTYHIFKTFSFDPSNINLLNSDIASYGTLNINEIIKKLVLENTTEIKIIKNK